MIFVFLLMLSPLAMAKDHGTHGTVFEIKERSLLKVIQDRLEKRQAEIPSLMKDLQARTKERVRRPAPVQGLVKAAADRFFTYDPTLVLEHDITDHTGRIIATKGTAVNPLNHMSLSKKLLFFDGDDPDQVEWALAHGETDKLILVKGAPLDLAAETGRSIYFDQGGHLTKKFGFKQIPCRISQQDKQLRVEEIALKKEGEK